MTTAKELVALITKGNADELAQRVHNNPSLAQQKTEQGISLLQFAVYCRNKDVIDVLRPLCDLDLFEASGLGDLIVVQRQIESKPNLLNAFAADGFTALGLACFFDQHEVASYLLTQGSNPNIASTNAFKVAPIHSACAISNRVLTELLLKHGANVNAKQQNDITPLHEAAHNGKTDLTRLLLNNGADANAKTKSGQTPRAMAMEKGFIETATLLRGWEK